jgi:hypothetical protein
VALYVVDRRWVCRKHVARAIDGATALDEHDGSS